METWKWKPLVELPGKVSLWETAPVWSLTRGPPSSHTQISSATTCQPGGVKHRQADNIWHIIHKWARGRWHGENSPTHHGWFGIFGEHKLSDPVFLLPLNAASRKQPVRPARCPRPTAKSPADRAHISSPLSGGLLHNVRLLTGS